jgi:hypothetical protein
LPVRTLSCRMLQLKLWRTLITPFQTFFHQLLLHC